MRRRPEPKRLRRRPGFKRLSGLARRASLCPRLTPVGSTRALASALGRSAGFSTKPPPCLTHSKQQRPGRKREMATKCSSWRTPKGFRATSGWRLASSPAGLATSASLATKTHQRIPLRRRPLPQRDATLPCAGSGKQQACVHTRTRAIAWLPTPKKTSLHRSPVSSHLVLVSERGVWTAGWTLVGMPMVGNVCREGEGEEEKSVVQIV